MKLRQFINQEVLIVLLCVLSTIAVYWHDLTILFDDAVKNEMASYNLALPFLVMYIVYRNRRSLKARLSFEVEESQNISKNVIGVALCLSALFLYLYGSFTFTVLEYHLASMVIFIFGCSVFLLGIQNLKNMIFPLGFVLLLIIPYREETYQVSSYLSVLTSTLSFNLLKLLGYPVSLSTVYDSPSIMVETSSGQLVPFVVDIPCAGTYSLIGFSVFALFFAYISHGSGPKKGLWLVLGFLLIYAINIIRVASILVIGFWLGVETAMGLFHLVSGSVLIFLASLLMIVVGEKSLKVGLFKKNELSEYSCPSCQENEVRNGHFCRFCGKFFYPTDISISKLDIGKILVLSLVFGLLINLQVPSFALAQQNIVQLDASETIDQGEARGLLPMIDGYEPRFVYRDKEFESISQQDASLLYVYHPQNSSRAPIFVSVEIGGSYSKIHRWEVCLEIAAPKWQGKRIVEQIELKDVRIRDNPPLVGRLFVYRYLESEQTVMILYWYESGVYRIGDVWGNKYIKTSLIAYLDSFVRTAEIESLNKRSKIESKLVLMAKNVINYREPVKEWSAYVVVFAGHGQTLSVATLAISSFLVAVFHFKNEADEKNMAYSIYKQLVWHSTFSETEREVLKVLEILNEKQGATGTELVESYRERTGKKIDAGELARITRHAEDYGLVRKEIRSSDGKPVMIWRSTIIPSI